MTSRPAAGIVGRMQLCLDDLLEIERHGWEALCRSDGAAFYGEVMTSDGVMVLVNGMVLDRDEVAVSLAGAPAWDRFEIADARMIGLGVDAAALVYHATAVRDGEAPFRALMSSVYRLVDGVPRLALYQQTQIA